MVVIMNIELSNERFDEAKEYIYSQGRNSKGIGTLSEKDLHAILKHYIEPDEQYHEVPIDRYVADVCKGNEIFEVQTGNFNKLRDKLTVFLKDYKVTVVYPMPHNKWLTWIDEATGEIQSKRKSPKCTKVYEAFSQLYKIKPYLDDKNIRVLILLIDMEEQRILNGWSKDKKRGSVRFDRIPYNIAEQYYIERPEDYMQFLPYDLPDEFCAKDVAKCAPMPRGYASVMMTIMSFVNVVERVGKKGNNILYKCKF